jgi:pyruvate,water dikinase
MNHLIGGHQPEIRTPPPTWKLRLRHGLNLLRYLSRAHGRRRAGCKDVIEIMATAKAWRSEELPQDDREFAVILRRYMRYTRAAYDLHFLQGSASGALNFLVDTIEARLPGEGHSLAAALMAGDPPSVTAQQGYDLIEIAQQAVADQETRSWLQRRCRGEVSDWQELPQENAFRQSFADFLDRYGHRGVYETYTRNPRWREQHDYLLDSLLDLAETDLVALQQRYTEAATQARKRVAQALPWWKRPLLGRLIQDAKAGSNEREAARSAMISQLEVTRRALLTLGECWVGKGYMENKEDILFLLQTEIHGVLNGVRPSQGLAALIAERKRLFEAWQDEEAPEVILEQPDGSLAEQANDYQVQPTNGDCFTGVAVGAGFAQGRARLLTCPKQGDRLARGEILVVPSTDPAWTPLFLKAGGLVMETGGYLSHGAIVAREFGIPAVVNLPGILQQIADGDLLAVDGAKGTVRRLES